jgi:hypothetical protein
LSDTRPVAAAAAAVVLAAVVGTMFLGREAGEALASCYFLSREGGRPVAAGDRPRRRSVMFFTVT